MNKTLLKLATFSAMVGLTGCASMPKEVYNEDDFKENDTARVIDTFMSKTAPDKPTTFVVEFSTDRDSMPEFVAGIPAPTPQELKAIQKEVKIGQHVSLKKMAQLFKGVHYVNTKSE